MIVEKIYLDMDGVLADFDRGVAQLCNITPLQINNECDPQKDDEMWAEIKKISHFYDKLELIPGAKEMFDMIYGRYGDRCEILTGIPKQKRGIVTAGEDKINWVRRLLSKDIKINIVYRAEKSGFCSGSSYILIDDYKKTIGEWSSAGGTGIWHISAEDTISRLKELGIL